MTSPIKRRMWPGWRIADGMHFVRVKFTDKVQSLPYSTKFITALGPEYLTIRSRCVAYVFSHIMRECPEFLCHKCGVQGHFARECVLEKKRKCQVCRNDEAECVCNVSGDSESNVSESDMEAGDEIQGSHELGSKVEEDNMVDAVDENCSGSTAAAADLRSCLGGVKASEKAASSATMEERLDSSEGSDTFSKLRGSSPLGANETVCSPPSNSDAA